MKTKTSQQIPKRQFYTPTQLASRWQWHPESARRAIRQRRLASVRIGRRSLVPAKEVLRLETAGHIASVTQESKL